jgi:hypothetical protein
MRVPSLVVCLFAVVLCFVGCGPSLPPLGDVFGTVTFNGTPAANVTVTFTPVGGGRAASAVTDESGGYTLIYSPSATGAVVGECEVTVSPAAPSPDAVDLHASTTVPAEFMETRKQVEVKGGKNQIDLSYPE